MSLENRNAVNRKRIPIGMTNAPNTEPLPRYRVPVLHSGKAYVAYRHAGMTRQAFSYPMGVVAGFFDPQEIMLALSAKLD